MTVISPAIFHREGDAYWVEFPDLEGCNTFGDSISATLESAREALSGYCAVLLEQGKTLPTPSDITTIQVPANSFASLVDTKPADYRKAVKKTLTIPAWLNTVAEEAHAPYSKILQDALERYLGIAE